MKTFSIKRLSNRLNFLHTTTRTAILHFLLTAGLAGLLLGCSLINLEDHRDSSSQKVQQAVDNVRADLEKSLGNQAVSYTHLDVYKRQGHRRIL